MTIKPPVTVLLLQFLGLAAAGAAGYPDRIDVKVKPAMREYCHVVQFRGGWKLPDPAHWNSPDRVDIDYVLSDYEVRVEGVLGTWFLVGAFHDLYGKPHYSTNYYRVNFSDSTAPALPATRQHWEGAAVVPLARKSIFPLGGMVYPSQINPTTNYRQRTATFNGFEFMKSGSSWANLGEDSSRISPDSETLVLGKAYRGQGILQTNFGELSAFPCTT